jgi:serine/threonine protein phosphatase PrpC
VEPASGAARAGHRGDSPLLGRRPWGHGLYMATGDEVTDTARAAAGALAELPAPAVRTGSVTAATQRGRGHEHNEDRWGSAGADGRLLLVVADGMGGTVGGGTAAGIALRTMLELSDDPAAAGPDPRATRSALVGAIDRAHQRVQAAAPERLPDWLRPGCTVTVALVSGDRLLVGHVGDSACWLLRRGTLIRLTEEHTQAAMLVAAGAVDRASPAAHRLDNLLTRHVGMEGSLRPQLCAARLRAGDRLLVATDGLSRALPSAALAALLSQPGADAARLVAAAVAAGSRDDVTAVLATVGDLPSGYAAPVDIDDRTAEPESSPVVPDPDGSTEQVAAAAEAERDGTAAAPAALVSAGR